MAVRFAPCQPSRVTTGKLSPLPPSCRVWNMRPRTPGKPSAHAVSSDDTDLALLEWQLLHVGATALVLRP